MSLPNATTIINTTMHLCTLLCVAIIVATVVATSVAAAAATLVVATMFSQPHGGGHVGMASVSEFR